jgi:hypothetical protein
MPMITVTPINFQVNKVSAFLVARISGYSVNTVIDSKTNSTGYEFIDSGFTFIAAETQY